MPPLFFCFSARRPHSCGRRFSIIPYLQQFVNRQNKQNNHPRKSRICAKLPIDFWYGLWYTIIVKRGYTPPEINRHQGANGKQIAGGWKDFQKIFQIYWKKYLTRFGWCAIMMVHSKGTPRIEVKEKFSKTLKNLLTNRPSCDTISTQGKESWYKQWLGIRGGARNSHFD